MTQRNWLFHDATGLIHSTYSHHTDEFLATDTPAGLSAFEVTAPADSGNHYVDLSGEEPVVAPRPMVPELVESQAGTWAATGCPDGMEVAVWDADLGTLLAEVPATGGTVEVTLTDPGPYRLVSVAPFPYLARTLEVEIA